MSIFSQVLGTDLNILPPAVRLVSNGEGFLFNAGDNIQRIYLEHGLKLSKTRVIFFTRAKASSIGGLLGALLTLARDEANSENKNRIQDHKKNADKPTILIVCQEELKEAILYATSSFAPLRALQYKVRAVNCEEPLFLHLGAGKQEIVETTIGKKLETVESISVLATTVTCYCGACITNSKKQKLDKSYGDEEVDIDISGTTICYFVRCRDILGKFYPEKAKKLGIPKGPLYGVLKKWQPVTLPCGRVIQPPEVCDPPIPGRQILLLDCLAVVDVPKLKCTLEKIVREKEINGFEASSLQTVYHMAGEEVRSSKPYQEIFNMFEDSNSLHVPCFYGTDKGIDELIMFDEVTQMNYPLERPFISAYKMSAVLNRVLPKIFSQHLQSWGPSTTHEKMLKSRKSDDDVTIIQPLTKIIHEPVDEGKRPTIDSSCSASILAEQGLRNFFSWRNQREPIVPFHEMLKVESEENKKDFSAQLIKEWEEYTGAHTKYPALLFLGTGASSPSPYRNVSSTVVLVAENYCILLDVGEGTLSQLRLSARSYEEFCTILAAIRIIFISHMHADHHLGLMLFLTQRHRIIGRQASIPHIIGPPALECWLAIFSDKLEKLHYTFHHSYEFDFKAIHDVDLLKETGLPVTCSLKTFEVEHISSSRGLRLEIDDHSNNGPKKSFVYTGDTKKSEKVVQAAEDCDILIHEATFEKEYEEEAADKAHSTIPQAIEIGTKARCKHLILTHFSQRSNKMGSSQIKNFGKSESEFQMSITYAFDGMKVPFNFLSIIPVYNSLIQGEIVDFDEKC